MPNELAKMNSEEPLGLVPDFAYEDRHEFVERRAYEHWEKRGRPVGSPEIDWAAAEESLYLSLVASGLVKPSATDLRNLSKII